MMLKWVDIYNQDSNGKVNISKSEKISFGKNKNKCKDICNIKESKNDVRYLGIYFNQKGVANKYDEIIKDIVKHSHYLQKITSNIHR